MDTREARTMYRVNKREYQLFASSQELAEIARRIYPELKGGRITNVLQMMPSRVLLGKLYKNDEVVR